MTRMRRRSLADQAARLTVLGLLVAVLTLVAVGAPRLGERMLDADLRTTVSASSPSARDLVASVDAAHVEGDYPDQRVTIAPTWNAMPKALASTRASMPAALRDVTGGGRYTGEAGSVGSAGTAGIPGFGLGPATGSPGGIEVLSLEAYPQLRQDAELVSGTWPGAWAPGRPIPLVLTAATATKLGWRLGVTRTIAAQGNCGSPGAARMQCSVQLVGTVAPRETDSGFWRLETIRAKTVFAYNSGGNPVYGSVGFVASDGWPALAPHVAGTGITTWYDVAGDRVSLAALPDLQAALTSFLANPRVIDDGTEDAHSMQFATLLPNILNGFQATRQASSAVMALAVVAALGVGLLVLLTTVSLLVRSRRSVRELMRVRGATVAGLARGTVGELAWAVLPGAVLGAAAGMLLAVEPPGRAPLGAREIVTALICALAPLAAAATFVVVAEGVPDAVRAAVARQRWIGEAFVVLVAGAAFATVLGEAGRAGTSGTPDPLSIALVLLAGVAGSVIVLRGYPLLLRAFGHMLGGRGRPAAFVGVVEATRTSGVAWPVTAALTAAAAGVLTTVLLTSVAGAAGRAGDAHGPVLLPGLVAFVVVGVTLCSLFSAAAFAVSSVATAGIRRRRLRILHLLGFSGAEATRAASWSVVPAAIVSVVVGVAIGVLCGAPVIGAFPALPVSSGPGGSGGSATVTVLLSWPLVGIVAGGILALALIISFIAIGADARAIARESRKSS